MESPIVISSSNSSERDSSPESDQEGVNNNKRKRLEDEEGDLNVSKRRSEEPLVRVKQKIMFVDETATDDSDLKSKSCEDVEVIKENKDKTKDEDNNKAGTKDDESEEEEEAWEVEEIIDYQYCRESEEGLYQVKWINWGQEHNTWEPEAHLECKDMLVEFYKMRLKEREGATPAEKRALELPPDPRESFQIRQDFIREHCPPPSKKELQAMFIKEQKLAIHKRAKVIPEKMMNAAVDQLAKSSKPNDKKLAWIREQLKIRELHRVRGQQIEDLKKYEKEINEIDPHAFVSILNDADLEGPPRQMQYINAYKASDGINIPDDPFIGCECENCELKCEKTCCGGVAGFQFAYTKHSKLRIDVGQPIYECNKRCACGPECTNRVVQKGRKHKLQIYRTDNGCGWGVRAMENIRAGSFVVEYVGEVITSDEAEERGKKYDAEGRTYLFDLDFNLGDENLYTVDAAFYGNCSHFINHSCDPNLNIFNVYINNLDPNMPQLCLFARREIKRGEQISFDYCQSTGNVNSQDLIASPLKKVKDTEEKERPECRCGSANCRKVLF